MVMMDFACKSGEYSCLVISGVPTESAKFHPALNEVVSLGVFALRKADKESVEECLNIVEKNKQITIDSLTMDGGKNLQAGARLYSEEKKKQGEKAPQIIYDITHKLGRVLVHQLEEWEEWKEFCQRYQKCEQQTRHQILASYAPPSMKADHNRWLNLESPCKWLVTMEKFLEKGDFEAELQMGYGLDEKGYEELKELFPKRDDRYGLGNLKGISCASVEEWMEQAAEKLKNKNEAVLKAAGERLNLAERAVERNFGWVKSEEIKEVSETLKELLEVTEASAKHFRIKGMSLESAEEWRQTLGSETREKEKTKAAVEEIKEYTEEMTEGMKSEENLKKC